jgi:hypothetical protein
MKGEVKSSNTALYHKNYNFTYQAFFESYNSLASEIIKARSILKINNLIFSFISTYNFGIVDTEKKEYFIETIYKYNIEIKENKELKKVNEVMDLNIGDFQDKIKYYDIYYFYMIKQLTLLGEYSEYMGYTFMPQKDKQSRYVGFVNNTQFFECITALHKQVANNIKSFKLSYFVQTFNAVVVYYHLFYLFIEESKRESLESMLSIVLSEMLNKKTAKILSNYPHFNKAEERYISNLQHSMFIQFNYINSKINESFSNFEIFPKIKRRVYIDKTLI